MTNPTNSGLYESSKDGPSVRYWRNTRIELTPSLKSPPGTNRRLSTWATKKNVRAKVTVEFKAP